MLLAALTAFSPSALLAPVAIPAANSTPSALQSGAPATAFPRAGGWQWPLAPAPAVVRPFHAPPTPWSAGHRGVDLAGRPGNVVLSAGTGRVTFRGAVAGRAVVVVTHPGGLRTSYEPVSGGPLVGTVVAAGSPIGVLDATAGHCAPATCLHWGLRVTGTYLDPLSLLEPGPPVLKPWGPPVSLP